MAAKRERQEETRRDKRDGERISRKWKPIIQAIMGSRLSGRRREKERKRNRP
jgi:hypothetical protein